MHMDFQCLDVQIGGGRRAAESGFLPCQCICGSVGVLHRRQEERGGHHQVVFGLPLVPQEHSPYRQFELRGQLDDCCELAGQVPV